MFGKSSITEVCTKAADLIEKEGWRQGGSGRGYCLEQALISAIKGRRVQWGHDEIHVLYHHGVYAAVQDHIAIHQCLYVWNDAIATSQEQVVTILREVAEAHDPKRVAAQVREMGKASERVTAALMRIPTYSETHPVGAEKPVYTYVDGDFVKVPDFVPDDLTESVLQKV
jgi:hypothetical protein